MNAVTAVANHLNVVESAVVRVEEWANCLFTVVKGLGARFVSKKVVKVVEEPKALISPEQFAEALSKEIKSVYTPSTGNLKGSVWSKKSGETRIYLKTWKGADCGYVSVIHETSSVRNVGKSYVQDAVDAKIDALLERFEISSKTIVSKDPLSQALEEMCWQCGYNNAAFSNGLCVSCVD